METAPREPTARELRKARPKPAPPRLLRRSTPSPAADPVPASPARVQAPVQAPPPRPAKIVAPKPAHPPARPRVRPATPVIEPVLETRVANPAANRPPRTVVAEPAPDPAPPKTIEREWWVIALLVGAGVIATTRLASGLPDTFEHLGAAVVSCALAWGLAVRTGGRQVWAGCLAAVICGGAVVSDWAPLTSGAAVATGVLAATTAIMVTMPAATFSRAIREVVIASAVAWLGALGVVGYGPGRDSTLDVDRFEYVVLGLALVGAFALVYRLGAGLHGLGRRGYVVAGGAVVMLVLALAYSEAIAQWGSRDIVSVGHDVRDWMKGTLGAVPHPIVALLGYPALVWGVFMRARRRQGWWVCAFGVAATAPTATRLIATDLDFSDVALGALYSFVIGMVVGYLVIRVEQSFTGTHGRRARRDEEAVAHRPEPRRTLPLH